MVEGPIVERRRRSSPGRWDSRGVRCRLPSWGHFGQSCSVRSLRTLSLGDSGFQPSGNDGSIYRVSRWSLIRASAVVIANRSGHSILFASAPPMQITAWSSLGRIGKAGRSKHWRTEDAHSVSACSGQPALALRVLWDLQLSIRAPGPSWGGEGLIQRGGFVDVDESCTKHDLFGNEYCTFDQVWIAVLGVSPWVVPGRFGHNQLPLATERFDISEPGWGPSRAFRIRKIVVRRAAGGRAGIGTRVSFNKLLARFRRNTPTGAFRGVRHG